ncbi:MAG TPA: CoA pyrophosphatase [Anaerolineae bacterium]|nr:CoA pyrophosphatase [Anaerolineae bacterium]
MAPGYLCEHPQTLIAQIHAALQATLPGQAAQGKMAPANHLFTAPVDSRPRQAAVLILFLPQGAHDLAVLFTQRTLTVAHHKGQICFPGGRQDVADHTLLHTALRETAEEIGLPATDVVILGSLTPLYVSASNHLVHPVVGWIPWLPRLAPNPTEVAQVLFVPLSALLDPQNVTVCTYASAHRTLTAPGYAIGGQCIWGATAMMTSELLEIIRPHLAHAKSTD